VGRGKGKEDARINQVNMFSDTMNITVPDTIIDLFSYVSDIKSHLTPCTEKTDASALYASAHLSLICHGGIQWRVFVTSSSLLLRRWWEAKAHSYPEIARC
jgi:hypothetical protein